LFATRRRLLHAVKIDRAVMTDRSDLTAWRSRPSRVTSTELHLAHGHRVSVLSRDASIFRRKPTRLARSQRHVPLTIAHDRVTPSFSA
jgi:hypothetical protein